MISKEFLKRPFFFGIVVFLSLFLLTILLQSIINYEKKIEKKMLQLATSDVFEIVQHKALLIENIFQESDDYIKDIKANTHLQNGLEKSIESLRTENIKYVYILYKDKNDVLRFLVDGSPENEKSMLNQKFDVTSEKWFTLYEKKEPMIIEHNVLQQLFVSFIVPIFKDGEVELILAIDYSVSKIKEINEIIFLMKSGIVLIIAVIFISFIVFIYQFLKYRSIKKVTMTDSLTQLYNRHYLDEIIKTLELEKYTLAVIDLDYFKRVNDTYGHDIGDIVLKEFATTIKEMVRINEDIAIRYGGEEFIVFIKRDTKHIDASLDVIQRMFTNIKNKKIYIDEQNYIQVTVSIGVNSCLKSCSSFEEAFKLADLALYRAKKNGRDRIELDQ